MILSPEEFSTLREELRRKARIWLDGQAYDQLERIFAHIVALEAEIELLNNELESLDD